MDKLNQISDLERQIEVLKEEMQKDNKEIIMKISSDMNIYFPCNDDDMDLITDDLNNYAMIESIMKIGYIKVEEYIYYLNNTDKSPVEIKILNRIKELETSLVKQTKHINENDQFVNCEDYQIEDNLRSDIGLLKAMLNV
jgi:hypothetical protein